MNTIKKIFGYVRSSTNEQNESYQISELLKYGVNERDIFVDKVSGRTFNREQYQLLKKMLRPGDEVVILSLDRLGRTYKEMVSELNQFNDNGITVTVLDMPLLNAYRDDSSISQLIYSLTIQVLSFAAENEVKTKHNAQMLGIEEAKKKGVVFGRPAKRPENFESYYAKWKAGNITAVSAAKALNISRTTFYKLVRLRESEITNN